MTPPLVRLGIRGRREQAEVALAALLLDLATPRAPWAPTVPANREAARRVRGEWAALLLTGERA